MHPPILSLKNFFNGFTFLALLTALLYAGLPGVANAISDVPIPQTLDIPAPVSLRPFTDNFDPQIIYKQVVPQQDLITVASLEEWIENKEVIPQQQRISVAALEQHVVFEKPGQNNLQRQAEERTEPETVSGNDERLLKPVRIRQQDLPAATKTPDTKSSSQTVAFSPIDSLQSDADIDNATKVKIDINDRELTADFVQESIKINSIIHNGQTNYTLAGKPVVEPGLLKKTPAEIIEKPVAEISIAQQLGLGIKRIVIDPGHGGRDPGAVGFGLLEKDLVLKVSKMAEKILKEQYKYEVSLTREDDTFLSLDKRTAIANKQKADLFISIHVNAHPESSVKGVETFYLNFTNNKDAMRVAALENASSTHSINELQGILTDLMLNTNVSESSLLATFMQNSMVRGLHEENYHVRNLGVKQAPFYVLVGAKMPAILLEISYITNLEEAQRLKEDNYLLTIAEQIAAGVKVYAEMRKTLALQ